MAVSQKIKAALIDLNGTLHIESYAVPGAIEALKRLRSSDIGIRFVTNTSKESKRLLHDRLRTMGFEIELNEIYTSLTSARNLVEKYNLRPKLMLEDEAMEDFDGLTVSDNFNAVVIGLAPSRFNFKEMTEAFRLLLTGARFIAINKGRYYQRLDGPALGPGPFVTALEYATDRKAEVVGKPEKRFFLSALEGMRCLPNEAVMIGDDIRDDVLGAQEAGMIGILVQTGKYRDGDEKITDVSPNYVFKDFSMAVDFLLEHSGS